MNTTEKMVLFLKKYWREIVVVIMFLSILSRISDAELAAEKASRFANEAADYAAEAADAASDAASSASYCEYLN